MVRMVQPMASLRLNGTMVDVDHRRPSVHGFVAQASPTGGINAVWVMPEDDWEMSCVA